LKAIQIFLIPEEFHFGTKSRGCCFLVIMRLYHCWEVSLGAISLFYAFLMLEMHWYNDDDFCDIVLSL
jgi:hypothetical protein